eukprot:scaffold40561_cov72-Phaeocystis_antarctica.AAC.1
MPRNSKSRSRSGYCPWMSPTICSGAGISSITGWSSTIRCDSVTRPKASLSESCTMEPGREPFTASSRSMIESMSMATLAPAPDTAACFLHKHGVTKMRLDIRSYPFPY